MSGPEAHQSSGICLSGVPCLACTPPTATPTNAYRLELRCRRSNGMLNSIDHRAAEFVCFSTN